MITKSIITGMISILFDGQIQLRTDTLIIEDGKELSRTYHREVLEPGQDVSDRDPRTQAICEVVWTPEVIAAYDAAKQANLAAARNEVLGSI